MNRAIVKGNSDVPKTGYDAIIETVFILSSPRNVKCLFHGIEAYKK